MLAILYYFIASFYRRYSNFVKEEKWLEKAKKASHEKTPIGIEIRRARYFLMHRKGKTAEAIGGLIVIKTLADSFNFKHSSLKISANLGNMYCYLKDYDNAIASFESVFDDPNFEKLGGILSMKIRIDYSATLRAIGNFEKAISILQDVEGTNEDSRLDLCVMYQLGSIYNAKGEVEKAIEQLERAYAKYAKKWLPFNDELGDVSRELFRCYGKRAKSKEDLQLRDFWYTEAKSFYDKAFGGSNAKSINLIHEFNLPPA